MHLNSYYLPGPEWQGTGTRANTALLIFLSSYVNVNSSWLKKFEYSDVNQKLQNTKINQINGRSDNCRKDMSKEIEI